MDYLKENLIGKEFRSIKYQNGSIMIAFERGSHRSKHQNFMLYPSIHGVYQYY